MKKFKSILGLSLTSTALILHASGCGSSTTSTTTEDTSASGTVASAIGGGVQGSSGGTLSMLEQQTRFAKLFDLNPFFPDAYAAATACPTIAGTASGCAVNGSTATLTYSNCSFSGSGATWSGSQVVAFTGVVPACGTTFPTTQSSVVRTFGTGSIRTAASGTAVSVDTQGLTAAYTGSTYSGGTTTGWSGGVPTTFKINGMNLIATSSAGKTIWNHTLTSGTINISSSGGNITIPVGSSFTLYHNLAHLTATSTVTTALVFQSGSCTPTSGVITTTYATNSSALLAKYSGAIETLTFTGSGTATYAGPEGNNGNVTLAHCF